MPNNIHIYVFSFNRGRYLENCLKSIQICIPESSITIIDDQSSDGLTLDVLARLSQTCEVVTLEKDKFDDKTGGLYTNMNYAMYDVIKRKVKYVLFIQDDMQLVRPVTNSDLQRVDSFFECNSSSVQYYPCFFKSSNMLNPDHWQLDESGTAYLQDINLPYSGFSAVGIFHVGRFINSFGELNNIERDIDKKARMKGIQKGYAAYPFMMYLPFPISYRNRKRSFLHKFSERLAGAGFYPIQLLEGTQSKRLFDRNPMDFPFAEEFLIVEGLNSKTKWTFVGGVSALHNQGGYRSIIGRFLRLIG